MLSTLLAEYPWLARAAVLAIIIAAPFVAWLLVARRRVAGVLTALAGLAVAALTLYPDGRPGLARCIMTFAPADLLHAEPLANVVLFIPISLFLSTATRMPLLGLGAGIALTTIVEALQWAVPAIGRSCTLMDWAANAIGAALGAALAALALQFVRWRSRRSTTTEPH